MLRRALKPKVRKTPVRMRNNEKAMTSPEKTVKKGNFNMRYSLTRLIEVKQKQ